MIDQDDADDTIAASDNEDDVLGAQMDNGFSEDLADLSEEETLDVETDDPVEAEETVIAEPFGTMSAERPTDLDQTSGKFRIAILGDFSGRASRGIIETGADLANRKPIKFDIDNIEQIIRRFATTLVLPIGNDGAGVEVKLSEIDDLHPDELYENVAVFDELSALRQRVAMGDGAAAIADMQGWAESFGDLKLSSRKRAKGADVPADRKLSSFQSLMSEVDKRLAKASPASDLIERIVGPYVQAAPDPAQGSMLAAIDEAISGAMRAILHHPDFQAIEATWRSLDLLARRINTGPDIEIVLYDVSAEEWALDLSAQDDLAESGLFQMLAEEPRLDEAQGALSAVFGLYTLEETPPHAELLARMSRISAWMNAPFMTAISPKFLETPKHERHPLVAKTWDALSALPEAAYIGLAAPRFLLRLPYGKKTEPVDPFDFEEFSLRSGLKGMLWANPVILSAILMAETVNQHGKKMRLGQIMSLDDMPFHYMTDQYGDQVALPCTERLLNTRTTADVVARGFIPLLSIKGRNEVRQGSFQALGAGSLAGPWGQVGGSGLAADGSEVGFNAGLASDDTSAADDADDDLLDLETGEETEDDDLDALFADTDDSDAPDFGSDDTDLDALLADDDDMSASEDLDALLASFDDDDDGTGDGDDDDTEMDPELAALLEGL
ncbi:type VI secretion system contractile sheath large subunit [Cognatiyoonia sp. IB215446]|uniref:type VI secretion system contractile sheath domain-containing protein n=1 Tax=Cognatiyoonia sp. IB215446 TaxID=3097355 RepID=UPI002A12D24D|nr:type VI secretion system contractile sheath large subunit [Cognatiyoonia sp. IB215446]MDX8346879.1 type VI secretion system contractile sheath large subunit [Cognatiyoonia sp. IB215446]